MVDRSEWKESPVTPESLAEVIRGRRSVNRFRGDEVPGPGLIRKAIEVARWAPNHHHTEPWRFHLIGQRTKAAIIDLNTRLLRESRGEDAARSKRERWQAVPGWLMIGCVPGKDPITAREDHAACACAVQNLMLYLHCAGVGTKWTTGAVTREREFLQLLDAEDGEYCVGLIWYGYPDQFPNSQRRPINDVLRTFD